MIGYRLKDAIISPEELKAQQELEEEFWEMALWGTIGGKKININKLNKMTDKQKFEIQAIIKSLTHTLDEVENPDDRINITDITVETTVLIKDLLANYLRKKSK